MKTFKLKLSLLVLFTPLFISINVFSQAIKITTASCNALASITTLNKTIYADWVNNAVQYQFKFEEINGGGQIIEKTNSSRAINLLTIPGIKYNTNYHIYVRATTDGTFDTEVYGDYCNLITPDPLTWVKQNYCDSLSNLSIISKIIYCETIIGATDYQFKFAEVGGAGQVIEVKTSQISSATTPGINIKYVPGIKNSTTYQIFVKATLDGTFDTEQYSSYCQFKTPDPSINITASSCTQLGSITTLNNTFAYADYVNSAADYQFKFEEVGGENQVIEIKKSQLGSATSREIHLISVPGIKYNTTYRIYVKATVDGIFDTEQYASYCLFTTPSSTLTRVTTTSCNALTNLTSFSKVIYCEPIAGAQDYQFKFEEVGGANQVIEAKTSDVSSATTPGLILSRVPGLKENTTYRIYARATTDGTFDSEMYDTYCEFKTPMKLIKVTTSSCNSLSSINTLRFLLYHETSSIATNYRFKFEEVGGSNQVIEFNKSETEYPTTLSDSIYLFYVPGIKYNTTYNIYVKATANGSFTDSEFGTSCQFTTPSPLTWIRTDWCATLSSITSLNAAVYCEPIAGCTDYQFKFMEVGGAGQVIEIKKSQLGSATNPGLNLSSVPGIKYNTQYQIFARATFDGTFDTETYHTYCEFTTPPIQTFVQTSSCNTIQSITTLNNSILAEPIVGASKYQFKFEEVGGSQIIEYVNTTRSLYLLSVPGIKYSTSYKIYVTATTDGTFDTEQYSSYCQFTTPSPYTWVTTASCNALVNLTSINKIIYCEKIAGAQDYQFKFEEVGGTNQVIEVKTSQISTATTPGLNLSRVPGLKYGTTYNIYAKATIDGTFDTETYNSACQFSTPSLNKYTALAIDDKLLNEIDQQITFNNFSIKTYPNPFKDECLLLIYSDKQEILTVFIYDINGRIVDRFTVNTNIENTIGKNLNKGFYVIRVFGSNNNYPTLKMIKD